MYLTNTDTAAVKFLKRIENKHTKRNYSRGIELFATFLKDYYPELRSVNSISVDVFDHWLEVLKSEYKPATINPMVAGVRKFFDYLNDDISTNVNNMSHKQIKTPSIDRRKQRKGCLNETEALRFIDCITTEDALGISNKIMALVLINAGTRDEELARLQLGDIDFDGEYATFKISGKGMKERYITLYPGVSRQIMELIEKLEMVTERELTDDDYLIQGASKKTTANQAKPISSRSIQRRVKALKDQAGIDKDITPHSLRRTCATILYKRGVPIPSIQRLMGHEHERTTQGYIDKDVDIEVSKNIALDLGA